MFLIMITKRIYALTPTELNKLSTFLGINIDFLVGGNKDKRSALINYVIYGGLQDKVSEWINKHYGIAISYSYSVKDLVTEIKNKLIINGYNVVTDQSHIDLSGRCISSFEKILSDQPIFIGVLNDKYFESLNCMRELYLLCEKYGFDTNTICKHFLAIWVGHLELSISTVNQIAQGWKIKIEQHNKLLSNHNCSIREKLVVELDWYAKIYHQCTNILLMLKDISAIIVDDDIEFCFPTIVESIENKAADL